MTDEEERTHLAEQTRHLAERVKDGVPEGKGFALFVFDYGAKGFIGYASTAQRDDMLVAIGKWFIGQMGERPDDDPVYKRLNDETEPEKGAAP